MADRERCVFCTRERANEDDWNNPAMESDEPHAELDALCWDYEGGTDNCGSHMLEIGRPANLEDALPYVDRLDTLLAGLKAEVSRLRAFAKQCEVQEVADVAKAQADRLEHLLEQAGGEGNG